MRAWKENIEQSVGVAPWGDEKCICASGFGRLGFALFWLKCLDPK